MGKHKKDKKKTNKKSRKKERVDKSSRKKDRKGELTLVTLLHSVIGSKFSRYFCEAKTICGSRVHIFPRFMSATCNYFGHVTDKRKL